MIDLMDNLVARWERFAGKPYAKPTNKPSGLVIRNTVSQAQDTLYRLKLGRVRQCWLDVVERLNPVQPAGPPQTLGELCCEVVNEVIVQGTNETPAKSGEKWEKVIWDMECPYFGITLKDMTVSRRDIQELREVMYHKHKDPKEERLYRLIDLVRNA